MFSAPLENAVASVEIGMVTDGFIALLLFVFLLACLLKRTNKLHAFTQYAPTLLTTLGILGTFFGIVSGLLAFDVTNIDSSIEGLLGGMKTAFITSLVGMFLSILYKVLVSIGILYVVDSKAIDEDQIGAADLYRVLQEQRDGISTLNQAIGSGDESSLTGQLKLLRSDMNDAQKQSRREFEEFQEKLWIKLQDFADMLSKSATEAVIDALRQVITDFNNNLTEQFGENFKELNKAVEKLVQWQDNYKGQIDDMTQQYAQGVTAITETQMAVSKIQEHTHQIPESMNKLGDVMTVNQHQIDELGRHLEAFQDVRDKAVEAVPQLKEQIGLTVESVNDASKQLVEGIGKVSETLQTSISQSATEFQESAFSANQSLVGASDVIQKSTEETGVLLKDLSEELNSTFRTLAADMNEQNKSISDALRESGKAVVEEAATSRQLFESGLESMRNQLTNSLEQMADQQSTQVQGLIAGLKESMEEAMRKSAESVEGGVEILDQALQSEINRAMEQMGAALVSITGKFTDDYQALVNQMDRVIRTSVE
ncbi:MotA/TolQ/ExbB proton channel family protein [Amphritea sp. 2_MG-2023]|uniref:MotA/TolQ/ExbB proton channel family protein n=1 Tax=Amphritea TaxID=515417 RepID=UPI001C07AC61|nr:MULTISPECIES: MotA/TolQ/ExbB proton channel family protein [Amphritea]MBU2964024.1 MotA/TolQ/ExbB proton channel family protein [Amphritea atlantica]MDO6418424.1 MotA/TolQ/ExbB proton channel family protein [Amphritea sp. 2_MG-2023]